VSLFRYSSDAIGDVETTYSVCLAPRLRKQWMLMAHTPGCAEIAAYFRNEAEARRFADTFDLSLKEHAS
jgi:hypothetical protein